MVSEQEFRALYVAAGYRIEDISPRSVVAVSLRGVRPEWAEYDESGLEENLDDYRRAKEGLPDSEKGFNLVTIVLKNVRHPDPEWWILPPLAQIPDSQKYLLLDPLMMHWVFAHHFAQRKIPGIVF